MAKREDNYVDGAAFGEAPMGPAPQGQSAGEMYPGNPRMSIDTSNPNPSNRDMRIDALYNTIENRDAMKRDAGKRMMSSLTNVWSNRT